MCYERDINQALLVSQQPINIQQATFIRVLKNNPQQIFIISGEGCFHNKRIYIKFSIKFNQNII